ncbi:hypothetical protein BG011_009674 [Mortierella polycephala]|uniref:Uncharacterized protein n=1 Tax=Mortierella polycephala TaxID=41804 RepID=A0A9P6PNC5_9FUNG|nr:hypothetical protein BG011_009674 [Mortierella polycephala]
MSSKGEDLLRFISEQRRQLREENKNLDPKSKEFQQLLEHAFKEKVETTIPDRHFDRVMELFHSTIYATDGSEIDVKAAIVQELFVPKDNEGDSQSDISSLSSTALQQAIMSKRPMTTLREIHSMISSLIEELEKSHK